MHDKKVKAIRGAPTPRNVTELRSFLGMLAALSNFIPRLSTLAHPLYELLGNKPGIVTKPLMYSNIH